MFFEWQDNRSGEYFPSFISAYWKGKVTGTWLNDCCATSICSSELFVGQVCTVTGTTHQNKSLSKKQGLTCNTGSCRSNYVAHWRIGLGNCGEVLQELEWVMTTSVGGCLYPILASGKMLGWNGFSPHGVWGLPERWVEENHCSWMQKGVRWWGFRHLVRKEQDRSISQNYPSLPRKGKNQAPPACAAAPVTLITN